MIFLRHPAAAAAPGICYGRLDIDCAPGAEAEIAALLAMLPPVSAVVSGPAVRCRRLACRIAARDGQRVALDERLSELDFGAWEGRSWAAIPRAESDHWAADPEHVAPPGGETFAALRARVAAALVAAPAGAAIVTHAGVIRAARMILAGTSFAEVFATPVPHCTPIRLEAARPAPMLDSARGRAKSRCKDRDMHATQAGRTLCPERRSHAGGAGSSGVRISLILGGARSGKSARALQLATGSPRVFVATAEALDAEMAARIARHRAERGPGWRTIESALDIAPALAAHREGVMVVDCLTLWLSNLMHSGRDPAAEADALVDALRDCGRVILVSNEVGLSIAPSNALARRFRDEQGRLNQRLAAVADHVEFVTAGLPLTLKGSP